MRNRLSVFCVLIVYVLCAVCAAQAVVLPASLTALEDESLRGTALTGLVTLPDTMNSVGDHVFDGTEVYALDIPAGVASFGENDFGGHLAYAILRGDPQLAGALTDARYLFCAGESDIPGAFMMNQLVSDGMFWYLNDLDQLMLLCAVDNTAVPAQVQIPTYVAGFPVRALANDCLVGCPQVTDISLPFTIREDNPEAFASCPDVRAVKRPGLELWWPEYADEVNCGLLEDFLTAYPQYADWDFVLCGMGEGEAAGNVVGGEKPDLYFFAQDQLASLSAADGLSEVPAAYRAAVEGNDAGAVAAATLDGRLLAYPITADNGYFLYYDDAIMTDPGDLDTLLYDCERAGCTFYMELTSGWYNVAFFYGAGCELSYEYEHGEPVAFHGDLASENGLRALKAMIQLASSPVFRCGSSADAEDPFMAALVSGAWDANSVAARFSICAAAKLPCANGFQLGSFGGFKLIGVKDNGDADALAAAHALAAWLSSADAQAQRQNALEWLSSHPQARAQAQQPWYLDGLSAQNVYAHPQGQFPAGYWDIASALGQRVIAGELNDKTDAQLMEVLQQYQNDLAALVQTNH